MGSQENASPALNPKFLKEQQKLADNVSELKKEVIKIQKAFN